MNVIKACKYGLTLYNSNDMYVGKSLDQYGEYAEAEIDLFKELIKEGDTVYDIGANIGSHTLAMARMVGEEGTVAAFEPQRQIYYVLCGNIALNNLSNVHCMPIALSNIAGSIKVPELNFKQLGNFGALGLEGAPPDNFSIAQVMRLDDLNPTACNFIKVDVEGMESRVILGGSKTIDQYKPFLYVEDDRQQNSKDLVNLLHAHGYKVYLHSPTLFQKSNYFNNKINVFGGIMAVNLFCHHKSVECPVDLDKHNLSEIKKGEKNNFFEKHAGPSVEETLLQANQIASNEMTQLAKLYSETAYDFNKALDCLQKAIDLNPNSHVAYNNVSNLYTTHLMFEEALPYSQKTVELDPENPDAYINLGICHAGLKDYETSSALYKEILEEYPDNVRAKFHYAYDRLMQKDFSAFKEYECRFDLFNIAKICKDRYGDTPIWDGSELKETDRLLLFGEQGAGDMFQLARYLPAIKEKCGNPHIILELWGGMENIMAQCKGMDEIYILNRQDALPEDTPRFDYVASLFSIPHLLDFKSEEDFPLELPYIHTVGTAPRDDAEELEELLKSDRKMRIGISWSGNPEHKNDRLRSCWKKNFKPIEEIKDVQLYSLCFGDGKRTWADKGKVDLLEDSEDMDVIDLTKFIGEWNDTAKIIRNLDLIVSVDTGLAHLAGAMDKVVYLALPYYNDWRWYLDGDTSMWYPTMRIFRQPKAYDWDSVFEDIAASIKGLIEKYDVKPR
jgi:FkbM family methyltransferase